MGRARQTRARLVDQRARRRATSELVANHRDEFDRLYRHYRALAEEEADRLEEISGKEAPRLKTGRRNAEESVADRIDTKRCEQCVRYHIKGHTCHACGTGPPPVKVDYIKALSAQGMTPRRISEKLGIKQVEIEKVLFG